MQLWDTDQRRHKSKPTQAGAGSLVLPKDKHPGLPTQQSVGAGKRARRAGRVAADQSNPACFVGHARAGYPATECGEESQEP
ncbi:unnamed protein product [Merluccius merluccius]